MAGLFVVLVITTVPPTLASGTFFYTQTARFNMSSEECDRVADAINKTNVTVRATCEPGLGG